MLETVCTARKTIRIAGDDYPAELVKSKFLKLNSSHIEFVLDCMRENTTKVRNIKQYLKAVLFNAPSTIDSYYTALSITTFTAANEHSPQFTGKELIPCRGSNPKNDCPIRQCGKRRGKAYRTALQKAIKKFLEQKSKAPHGKQTMRQLMKQNAGVSNIEITDSNIKAFESTAKKYNIDFSLKKVKGEQTRYLVFFKGRDADVMIAAFQEFSAKKLNRDKKPSIRKALAAAKDKAKQLNAARDKVKKIDRGREI